MFRRRTPLTKLSQIRSVVWPERGFRRLFAYLFQRVVRLPDTSASVAVGVASGVAASFLPFIGLHFFIAALLALLLRGNVLASAIGTLFGNPWTFLFIWVSDYRLEFRKEDTRSNLGQTRSDNGDYYREGKCGKSTSRCDHC